MCTLCCWSSQELVGLDEYISRMKPGREDDSVSQGRCLSCLDISHVRHVAGQRHILYITGRTKRDAARSPYIEAISLRALPGHCRQRLQTAISLCFAASPGFEAGWLRGAVHDGSG